VKQRYSKYRLYESNT